MLAPLQARHAGADFSQITASTMTKVTLLLTLIVTVFVWLLPAVPGQAALGADSPVPTLGLLQ
jgi:hypothetical protein